MHTLLILEIIFYAIALLLFIAPITTFIKRGMRMFNLCYVKQTLDTILRKHDYRQ